MNSSLNILLAAWLFTMATVVKAETPTFYLLTEQYPPYNMTADGKAFAHSSDQIDGLCSEIIRNVFDRAGVSYRMKLRNWSFGMQRVQRNKDHGLFCMVKNAERKDMFHWVGPIANINWTLFAAPGSDIKLKSLKDAKSKGYVIGGYKGDVMSTYLQRQGFKVSMVNNDQHNPRRLQLGQIDLWVTDELTGPYKAADNTTMSDMKKVLTFRSTAMYLAINRETDPALVNKLQKALDAMRRSGVVDQIENNYGL